MFGLSCTFKIKSFEVCSCKVAKCEKVLDLWKLSQGTEATLTTPTCKMFSVLRDYCEGRFQALISQQQPWIKASLILWKLALGSHIQQTSMLPAALGSKKEHDSWRLKAMGTYDVNAYSIKCSCMLAASKEFD